MALISLKNIEQVYTENQKQIILSPSDIITPSAKDFLKMKGITLVYSHTQKQDSCDNILNKKELSSLSQESLHNIVERITYILINKYQITDSTQLIEYISEIVKYIQ